MVSWQKHRSPNGSAHDHARMRRDEAGVRMIKVELLELMERNGEHSIAARLRGEGSDTYPGEDEKKFVAEQMRGQVVIEVLGFQESIQVAFGDGPLVALLRYTPSVDGAGVVNPNHWVPVQSWRPLPQLERSSVGHVLNVFRSLKNSASKDAATAATI